MKEKTLKSSTIIPAELYVHRDADRQIKSIIENMGRPGYILVSRQMGKTNLLLNAKRQMESDSMVFAYVDMSRHYHSASECFRNIVDTIVKTLGSKSHDIRQDILESRKNNLYSPQIEHDNELLSLLSSFTGRIVIVLDEIDALTNTDFSDQVFAQIRSTYFSRITYDEFNRLTYILSGVVEPSNIIKDKNKSPFNIGEKIYLDDFSYSEYLQFVGKIKVQFSTPVIERIFYWTNGNPRMTWDLCSEVEDLYLREVVVSEQEVDLAVNKLYLKKFDTAPIDNIRGIVQSSFEIRQSVRKLNSFDNDISDDLKTKLYLAGIIRYGSSNVEIKNNIIKASLTQEWLNNIDKRNKTLLAVAADFENSGKFDDAIKCYYDYIHNNNTLSPETLAKVYTYISNCYRCLGNYSKALECLESCSFDKESQSLEYFAHSYLKGDILFSDNSNPRCTEHFMEVISGAKISLVKCLSYFKYVAMKVKYDFEDNKDEAISVLNNMISDIESNGVESPEKDTLEVYRHIAYLNLAQVYEKAKETSSAIEMYRKALLVPSPQYKPFILLSLYYYSEGNQERQDLIEEAINVIVENNLKFNIDFAKTDDVDNLNRLCFSSFILKEIAVASFACCNKLFQFKVLNYIIDNNYSDKKSLDYLLNDLSKIALDSGQYTTRKSIVLELINQITSATDSYNEASLVSAYRDLGITEYYLKQNYWNTLTIYFEYLKKQDSSYQFIDEDVIALVISSVKLRDQGDYDNAIERLKLLETLVLGQDNDEQCNVIFPYYHLAQVYEKTGDKFNAHRYASEGIRIIDSRIAKPSALISIKQIDNIKENLQQIRIRNTIIMPYINSLKIGRNDKCYCGSGKKYKKCHGA